MPSAEFCGKLHFSFKFELNGMCLAEEPSLRKAQSRAGCPAEGSAAVPGMVCLEKGRFLCRVHPMEPVLTFT